MLEGWTDAALVHQLHEMEGRKEGLTTDCITTYSMLTYSIITHITGSMEAFVGNPNPHMLQVGQHVLGV